MKLKEVFEKSVQFFKDKKIENPRRDVELLLAHALKTERVQLYLKYEQPLTDAEVQICREAIRRRGLGEPVAYITEVKGFYGQMFSVGAGVLIPRPETEMIVEEALEYLEAFEGPKILDLGAGTGCIGFSILKNHKTATLVSVERSEAAFTYLKRNQEALNLQDRSRLVLADVLELGNGAETFDVIVANPPYIAEHDTQTETNVKKFEPHEALFSANNGLQALFSWSQKARTILKKPGMLLFEMGYLQGPEFQKHVAAYGQFSKIEILKDLSGLDRILKCNQ